MKTRAGWKLWRRKPSDAPASEAESNAAPPRSSLSASTQNVIAVIAAMPAARPSMPSMKLTLFIRATIQITVTGYCSVPRSKGSKNGSVMWSIVAPAATGMIAAPISPASLASGGSEKRSSIRPTRVHATAPARIAVRRPARAGSSTSRGTAIAISMAIPPPNGIARSCSRRPSPGRSTRPSLNASRAASGVSASASPNASTRATSACCWAIFTRPLYRRRPRQRGRPTAR